MIDVEGWICLRCGNCECYPDDQQCDHCGWIRPGKITDNTNLETIRKLREWYYDGFYRGEPQTQENWNYDGSTVDLFVDMREIVEATKHGENK